MPEPRKVYAESLYEHSDATLDELREAETTLKETARTARRVLGAANPAVVGIENELHHARAALRFRESGDVESIREAVGAMTAGDP